MGLFSHLFVYTIGIVTFPVVRRHLLQKLQKLAKHKTLKKYESDIQKIKKFFDN